MSNIAIQCSELFKSFGETQAIRSLSFQLENGTILALLGPSGCGKTTALRLIGGFEKPESGTITINDKTVVGPSTFVPPEKRNIGMVFQDFALFPHLNIRQNIAYGIRDKERDKELLEWLINLVGLQELANRWPHEISGGEQQRVALARALASKPEMILLDEPFSNLDAALRVRVRSDLKRILRAAGTPPVIFVTHDQDEALSFADKVAVMFDGQVVQIDTPQNLYAHPNSLRVATFLGEANVLEGRISNGLVNCELGNLPYTKDSETHAEDQTKILIRPESLQLVEKDSETPTGEVMDREYYGHDQMILVQMPSGQILRCRCSPNTPVEKGDRVSLSIRTPVSLFQPTNDS